jgi:hypothetical protein
MSRRPGPQSGQVMVLVALSLLALIGSAALVLLAGSVEWQKNQLQQMADQSALDSALKIGVGCDAGKATTVITEADNFLATQRTRTGVLNIAAGTCATPYTGTDTFAGGLSATINYPYRAHQQQVEVILTLTLPISFGGEVGKTNTTVVRRAVAQQLVGSAPAVSATTLTCAAGQVNIGGSVVAQNLISRTGTCALYAHSRFDAASGTYSDLGNVSVYTDGQTWTAPGTCVAGSNAGSSSAICADGYELNGHNAPACAAAGTSFLSAGDATVNPNPCAAGKAPQPVPPVATTLPPEPNTDASAIATLQGTGGAACLPAGVYPNILVGGVTVGTGLAPAPIKDASGFYHFKPSCYGYLNVSTLGGAGAISNVQTGPEVNVGGGNVTATMPAASTAGNLLVVTVVGGNNVSPFTGPAGWTRVASVGQAGDGEVEVWYMANSAAGVTSAAFTSSSGTSIAQMSEWRGVATVAPVDATGTATSAASVTSTTVSTTTPDASAGDLGIVATTWTSGNLTSGAGWSTMYHDNPTASASDFQLALPAAVASEKVTSSASTLWADVIVTFKPGTGAGAVFDPGFYYFNGSGFAGGGGICLNGGTLLARDVTLEFVNQAGFSSGTCAPGGGANCAAPCAFGSPPCSLQACPPNVGADSPNNLTWFAAPCSAAPAADAASCPGSAWCPVGDRSCWQQMIWAPASNTGQIAIAGAAVNHWLLGSIYWPGTCTDTINGTSTIAGTVFCGSLSISAGAGAATAIGSDYGISTAVVEAILVE